LKLSFFIFNTSFLQLYLKVKFSTDSSVNGNDYDGFVLSWRCDPSNASPDREQFQLEWTFDQNTGGLNIDRIHIAFLNEGDLVKHQLWRNPGHMAADQTAQRIGSMNLGYIGDFDQISLKSEADIYKLTSLVVRSSTRSIDLTAGGPV